MDEEDGIGLNENIFNRNESESDDEFDEDGYDEDGYDEDGYDEDGYDEDGYDEDGLDIYRLNREGFDEEGFDEGGYDKNGFNREGIKQGQEYNKPEYLVGSFDLANVHTLEFLNWIHVQIDNDNINSLRQLIQYANEAYLDLGLNSIDQYFSTILYYALEHTDPNEDIVRLLLENGCSDIMFEGIHINPIYLLSDRWDETSSICKVLIALIEYDNTILYSESNDGRTMLSLLLGNIHELYEDVGENDSMNMNTTIACLTQILDIHYKFPPRNTKTELDYLCFVIEIGPKFIYILMMFITHGFNFNQPYKGSSFLIYLLTNNYKSGNQLLYASAREIIHFIIERSPIPIDMSIRNADGETLYEFLIKYDTSANRNELLQLLEQVAPVEYNPLIHEDAYGAYVDIPGKKRIPIMVPFNAEQSGVHLTEYQPTGYRDTDPYLDQKAASRAKTFYSKSLVEGKKPSILASTGPREAAVFTYNVMPNYGDNNSGPGEGKVYGPLDMVPNEVLDESYVYGSDSDEEYVFREPDERRVAEINPYRPRYVGIIPTRRREFEDLSRSVRSPLEDGEIDEDDGNGIRDIQFGEYIPGHMDNAAIPLVYGRHTIRRPVKQVRKTIHRQPIRPGDSVQSITPKKKSKSRKVKSISPSNAKKEKSKTRRHSRGGSKKSRRKVKSISPRNAKKEKSKTRRHSRGGSKKSRKKFNRLL